MVMGLALYTPLAIAGAIFYVLHHILVKTNLFLISGIVKVTNRSFLLKQLGGVYSRYPLVTILFVISAFSLAGIPPLSGFWSKFFLVQAGLATEQYFIVFISLLVGLLTLFSMSKIWKHVFQSKDPQPMEEKANLMKKRSFMLLPVIFLATATLFISFFPQVLFHLSQIAAEQLLNADAYINAVLK
jgi:multicomponent Na+:H+ antiporter subunit D